MRLTFSWECKLIYFVLHLKILRWFLLHLMHFKPYHGGMTFTTVKENIASECAVISISLPPIIESQGPTYLFLHYGDKNIGSDNLTFPLIMMHIKKITMHKGWETTQVETLPTGQELGTTWNSSAGPSHALLHQLPLNLAYFWTWSWMLSFLLTPWTSISSRLYWPYHLQSLWLMPQVLEWWINQDRSKTEGSVRTETVSRVFISGSPVWNTVKANFNI